MIENLKDLGEERYKKLQQAVADISVLIAGADGNLDKKETNWMKKLNHIRSYSADELIRPMYQELNDTIFGDIEAMTEALPKDTAERTALLTERLAGLNDIFVAIDNPELAYKLYESYTSYAEHIARASGGIWGIFSIGPKEAKLVDLDMINPIAKPEKNS